MNQFVCARCVAAGRQEGQGRGEATQAGQVRVMRHISVAWCVVCGSVESRGLATVLFAEH